MEKIPNSESEQKQVLWQKEKEIVDRITDRLGLEIDTGIKDTVIALRLLGINTTSSHEGKIDRYPVTYIDIKSPEAIILNKQREQKIEDLKTDEEKDIFKEIQRLWTEIQKTEDKNEEKKLNKRVRELEKKLGSFPYPKSQEITDLTEMIKS